MFRLIEVKYSLTFYNLWVNFALCVTTSLSDLWSSSLCSMLATRITRRTTVFYAPTSWPVTSVTSIVLSVLILSCSSVCGSWTAIRPNNLAAFFLASKEGSVSQSFVSCDTTLTHSSSLVVILSTSRTQLMLRTFKQAMVASISLHIYMSSDHSASSNVHRKHTTVSTTCNHVASKSCQNLTCWTRVNTEYISLTDGCVMFCFTSWLSE